MAEVKPTDLSNLSDNEISEKIDDTRRELFDLRFQRATRQLTETHLFKKARVQLAQLLTIQGERSRSNSSN